MSTGQVAGGWWQRGLKIFPLRLAWCPPPHGVPGALRCQNLVDAHLSLGLSDESVGATSVASNYRYPGCDYWLPNDPKYVSEERFINAPLLIALQCLNYSNDGAFGK